VDEKQNQPFQPSFNPSFKANFQSFRIASDSRLLLVRELKRNCLNSIEAADLDVQCSCFRGQKRNSDL
jgi:hypothetical protein